LPIGAEIDPNEGSALPASPVERVGPVPVLHRTGARVHFESSAWKAGPRSGVPMASKLYVGGLS